MNEIGVLGLTLWEEYKESLPDAPNRMAQIIIRNLRAKGFYLTDRKLLDDNPKGAIERESNYQRGTV
jgi:hypothetical protein